MKKNIAVILDQPEKTGGGFTHSINFCKDIQNKNKNDNLVFHFYCFNNQNYKNLNKNNIPTKIIKYTFFDIFIKKIMMMLYRSNLLKIFGLSHFEKEMIKDKIDLIFFTHPASETVLLRKLNFIYTLWDLCHIDHPEFPEIKYNREFISRECIYQLSCSTAVGILVESNFTKEEIIKRYRSLRSWLRVDMAARIWKTRRNWAAPRRRRARGRTPNRQAKRQRRCKFTFSCIFHHLC